MKTLQKFGGFAALYMAISHLIGNVIFIVILDVLSITDPAQKLAMNIEKQTVIFSTNLLMYVFFGFALIVLSLALYDRMKSGAPALMQVATAIGIIWAGSLIASSMAANAVDREEQLRWLLRLWREAEQGHGRVALLGAEAGIGKSRVVEALRERLAGMPHAPLFYQCSPHYVNTALDPLIQHIEVAAGIGREDTLSHKSAKLSAWLQGAAQPSDALPLLGALLSISASERLPASGMAPQRQKERTFELLLALMRRHAADRPQLIVFEDVHWADPTTLEFLAMLIARLPGMPALLVLTFRLDFAPPWGELPHLERRELEKLAPQDTIALAEQVAGARRLPETTM